MSVVGAAILLGLLVVALIRLRALRLGAAVVCVLFGLVLGVTPIGQPVESGLTALGQWLWVQAGRL